MMMSAMLSINNEHNNEHAQIGESQVSMAWMVWSLVLSSGALCVSIRITLGTVRVLMLSVLNTEESDADAAAASA